MLQNKRKQTIFVLKQFPPTTHVQLSGSTHHYTMSTEQLGNDTKKKMFIGIHAGKFIGELKLLVLTIFFLCTLTALLYLIPPLFHSPSLDSASSSCSSSSTPPFTIQSVNPDTANDNDESSKASVNSNNSSFIKRTLKPYGAAAYNFILMSAYRGGANTFAVVGLASKPLHVYGNPTYQCQWVEDTPAGGNHGHEHAPTVSGVKFLTDWGYGRVYTVVVINCTFPQPVSGAGKLFLHASSGDTHLNRTDTIEVIDEANSKLDTKLYELPPKYDYLYCGSPLYGELSPQRIREWIAYHVRLFGGKSHFVIHDAGGIHEDVLEVLKPWMELGYVTLQDVREQERFDGYYHNQFLVLNDCLHRYKFMAKWIFFFDVDEFIYIPPKTTFRAVVESMSEFTQFTIEQMPMSDKLCVASEVSQAFRKWGFEKLVYRDVKKVIRRDRKYAVQPRNVFATGVHMSQHISGRTNHITYKKIKYFHYHGTVAERNEPCRVAVNSTQLNFDGTPYVMDTQMRKFASIVKKFELQTIGPRLQTTQQ